MKKIFLFLLLPLLSFGQDMYIDHSVVGTGPYAVGDTITVKFNTINQQSTPTLIQVDYRFNNKLLQLINRTFKVNQNGTNSTAQVTNNSWTGYTFNPNASFSTTALSQQYNSGLNYSLNSDWTIERFTIQDGIEIESGDVLIEIQFIIKDRQGTSFDNYNEVTSLNWARAIYNANNTIYNTHSLTHNINLDNVSGVDAGNITINLNTPISTNYLTNYGYTIYKSSDIQQGIDQNTPIAASGNFNSNGQLIIQGLTNDVSYSINVYATNQSWLDDVVTVTDAYLIFQEVIGLQGTPAVGPTSTFSYRIQTLLAELTNDQQVNFDDSYIALAHINGVSHNGFLTNSSMAFNVNGKVEGFGDFSQTSPFNKEFTPTDNLKIFEIAHAFRGDVDFSHSYTPTVAGFTSASVSKTPRISKSLNAMKTPEQANLDIVSQLVNGKVVVTISTTKTGMVGAQFNINYDSNMLTLEDVVFDTGNTMTNFSSIKTVGIVKFGSLDQRGANTIKVGTPYKLIFTPKQPIQNTVGLVSFNLMEGVKTDGTKVKFNIQ
jgi:hypothetical protein